MTPVSPKVKNAGLAGLVVAAILALVQGLAGNADFIAALPVWAQPLVPAAAAVIAAVGAGYLTRDHLRDVGQTAVTDTTVPAEVESGDAFTDDQPVQP